MTGVQTCALPISEPAPAATAGTEVVQVSAPASESYQIEQMYALDDVHLNAPGRTMTARDRLDVEFDLTSRPTGVQAANAPVTPAPAPVAAAPVAAAPNAPAAAPAPVAPPEPNVSVKAIRVWARIRQRADEGLGLSSTSSQPAGAGKDTSQIEEVRLRGAVHFHQDPEPGKQRGTTVTGEALDMVSLGEGKSLFKVFHQIPDPNTPRLLPSGLASASPKGAGPLPPLARVDTEDFTIEGPVIGLDQKLDRAWVNGRGSLTQMAQRGLLTDKGLDNPAPPALKTKGQTPGPDPAAKQTPLKITWKTSMKFFGQPTDPKRPQVAHAEFSNDVRAEMEDALLLCQEMQTYMDRTVQLARAPKDAKAPATAQASAEPEAAEPRAQIAWIECFGGKSGTEERKVIAVSRKLEPESRILLQQQQIESDHLTYDKRTGNFHVPGPGLVYLYNREDKESASPVGGTATAAGRPPVRPIADANPAGSNTRRATAVVGRNSVRGPGVEPPGAASVRPRKPLPPLKLTQVAFSRAMKGRFGTGKDTDKTETRWADFFGDVQVLNGKVANEKVTFNFDAPPSDSIFLTSQTLRVVSEPTAGGAKESARNFLTAWDDAYAIAGDKTIQGDKITYDSLSELFYAYAFEGRKVNIAQQGQLGQPYTTTGGEAVRYNYKTGEGQLIGPTAVQLVDAKTGGRPGLAKPTDFKDDGKPLRNPYRKPGRSTTERKGFSGK